MAGHVECFNVLHLQGTELVGHIRFFIILLKETKIEELVEYFFLLYLPGK